MARNWLTFAALRPGEECGELLSRVIILIKICMSGQPAVWGDNGLNMNESLTRLHHYGLGSKYNNLGNILTQVRTIIFVLSVWMSHWSPEPCIWRVWGVMPGPALMMWHLWCHEDAKMMSRSHCVKSQLYRSWILLNPPTTGQGSQI